MYLVDLCSGVYIPRKKFKILFFIIQKYNFSIEIGVGIVNTIFKSFNNNKEKYKKILIPCLYF